LVVAEKIDYNGREKIKKETGYDSISFLFKNNLRFTSVITYFN
jgi:hypothetical protein